MIKNSLFKPRGGRASNEGRRIPKVSYKEKKLRGTGAHLGNPTSERIWDETWDRPLRWVRIESFLPEEEVRAIEDRWWGNPKNGCEEISVHMREQLRTGTGKTETHTKCSFNSDNNKRTALRNQCQSQTRMDSKRQLHFLCNHCVLSC